MSLKNVRLEVMQFLEKNVDSFVEQFLIPVEKSGNQQIFYQILKAKILLTR